MVRPIADRPSTDYAAQYGIVPPPGYKVNVNGQVVPEGYAQSQYDFGNSWTLPAGQGIVAGGGLLEPPQPDPVNTDYGYDNSGDYGGGGGSGYTPPPRMPLASSPEWLAYLNSLGLNENQFRADIDRQRGVVQAETERQIGELGPAYQTQRRGITGGLEARGMAKSGELLRRLAENRRSEAGAQSNIRAAGAGQLSSLESSLANRLIDLNSQKADKELSLRASGGYV